jgi:predicted glycoside hydrolase/deacetylase ChbG (UPF0249 family)
MVRPASAAEAAALAAERPTLSLGLHLDLGEWSFRAGQWAQTDHVVPLNEPLAVTAEIQRQIEAFRRLTGRNPTHLDSHQHVHREEPARSAALNAAEQLGVPLRHFTPHTRYCGDFYGRTRHNEPYPQAITPEALIRLLHSLPAGVTELACHPGEPDLPGNDYNVERQAELNSLCHDSVRPVVERHHIHLISFRELIGIQRILL